MRKGKEAANAKLIDKCRSVDRVRSISIETDEDSHIILVVVGLRIEAQNEIDEGHYRRRINLHHHGSREQTEKNLKLASSGRAAPSQRRVVKAKSVSRVLFLSTRAKETGQLTP